VKGREKCKRWKKGKKRNVRYYQFILPVRMLHFRSVSKTVSIAEDLGPRCDWKTCHCGCCILDASRKIIEKFSAALGFLSGVIAFCSGLIVTMTWLHYSVPMGLNVNVSSFPLMLSFMIPTATSIVAPVVLKNGLPRMSGV
jgi:hypothetical protein